MTSINWPPREKMKLLGHRIERLDGPVKSTGAAARADGGCAAGVAGGWANVGVAASTQQRRAATRKPLIAAPRSGCDRQLRRMPPP